jgi:hypothetical protein
VPILGFGVTFLGYSIFFYGLTQVRGGNWGLLDLIVPGRFDGSVATDSGGQQGASGGGSTQAIPPQKITQTGPNSATTSGSPGAGVTQTAPGGIY